MSAQPALVTNPQPWGSLVAWLFQCMTSLQLRGNAYGLVVARDARMVPIKILWIHPDRVQVDETHGAPIYSIDGREVAAFDVVHIPAYVFPGSIVGLSPVELFRRQFDTGHAAQEFEASFFDRGVAPAGVLRNTVKQTLAPGEGDIAKSRFKAAVAGRDIFVTGKDWEWTGLSVSAADATFLEAIEATATQVAAIFRVSPEDIGGKTGYSRTYQTLVQEMQKFATRTLLPWTTRIEDALNALLPKPQYVKFNLDALSRADLLTRMQAHDIATRIGLETNDEARGLEERPPLTPEQIDQWQNLYAKRAPAPLAKTTSEGAPA
jgi:HK97 family phage portal protein